MVNEIIAQVEKAGVAERPYSQMEPFREAIEDSGPSDLGYKGSRFTRCNNKEGKEFTKERLDRTLGNNEWHSLFSSTEVNTLGAENSDHSPLFIICNNQERETKSWRKVFIYEV